MYKEKRRRTTKRKLLLELYNIKLLLLALNAIFFFILTNRFVDAMLTLASTVGHWSTLNTTKGKQ